MNATPTTKRTVLNTTTDHIAHTINELTDGNFSVTVAVVLNDGTRHYQGGTYTRTEAEARQFLANFTL